MSPKTTCCQIQWWILRTTFKLLGALTKLFTFPFFKRSVLLVSGIVHSGFSSPSLVTHYYCCWLLNPCSNAKIQCGSLLFPCLHHVYSWWSHTIWSLPNFYLFSLLPWFMKYRTTYWIECLLCTLYLIWPKQNSWFSLSPSKYSDSFQSFSKPGNYSWFLFPPHFLHPTHQQILPALP